MKKITLLTAVCLLSALSVQAQEPAISQDVTVEHEYKPVIKASKKKNQTPEVVTIDRKDPVVVRMHAHTEAPLSDDLEQETHGTIEAALGHPQTKLNVHYDYAVDERNTIAAGLHHHAEWGLKTDEKTGLTFDWTNTHKAGKIYGHLEGSNEFFTYYGRYYSPEQGHLTQHRYNGLLLNDLQNLWRFRVHMGAASDGKSDFNYRTELAYHLYSRANSVTEHQLHARAFLNYRIADVHKVGLNLNLMNYIHKPLGDVAEYFSLHSIAHNSRHSFRIEPYYEWKHERVLIHAGVNLNFNIGKGEINSVHTDNLRHQVAFVPSPNIRVEGIILPNYIVGYVTVDGALGTSAMEAYYGLNKYANCGMMMSSHHVSSYKPVAVEMGFRTRPEKNLALNIHAGYELAKNQGMFVMNVGAYDPFSSGSDPKSGHAVYRYINYQRWKVGGELDYHYRDIIDVKLSGDWYAYRGVKDDNGTATLAYDRPEWEFGMKIVGHIDKHWSVYTWDSFKGGRLNRIYYNGQEKDAKLPAYVDMNIGAGYQFADTGNKLLDRLSLSLELKNFIHRKNMVWYGYESEGFNGAVGARWTF